MTDEHHEQEEQDTLDALRRERSEHTLALMEQASVKERVYAAAEEVIAFGFGCDILMRPVRGAIEFRLRVQHDGHGTRPARTFQAVADKFRLSLLVSSEVGDRVELIMYPQG